MDDDRIESLLVNRYLLDEKIGQGAMGQVYRALDTRLGSVVAIKFLAQTLKSPAMCDRFALEAKACAQLNSDFIVNVTDYGVDEQGIPFHVMEYLEGQNLNHARTQIGTTAMGDRRSVAGYGGVAPRKQTAIRGRIPTVAAHD